MQKALANASAFCSEINPFGICEIPKGVKLPSASEKLEGARDLFPFIKPTHLLNFIRRYVLAWHDALLPFIN